MNCGNNSIKALKNALKCELSVDNILLCQVYGSHVWGNARVDSDLDIFIITKEYSHQLNSDIRKITTESPNGVGKTDVWQLEPIWAQKYGGIYGTREHTAIHHGTTLYKSPGCTNDILAEYSIMWCAKEWLRYAEAVLQSNNNTTFDAYRACEYAIKSCLLHMGIRFNHKDARDLPRLSKPLPFVLPFDPYEMTEYRTSEEVDDESVATQARDMIRRTKEFESCAYRVFLELELES